MKRTKTSGGYPKKKKWTPPQNRAAMYKQIRTAVGVEHKYFDVSVGTNVTSSSNWASTNLMTKDFPQIAAGDDVFQRNGKKIIMQKMIFRGRLVMTPVTAQTSVQGALGIRVVLVSNTKTDPTAAANATTDGSQVFGLFADGNAPGNVQVGIAMFQNPAYFGQYKILKDKMLNIQPAVAENNTTASTLTQAWNETWFKITYKFPGGGQVLDFATTSAATPVNIGFQLLANADAAVGTPSVQGVLRGYYTDA